ncbi:MAG TPA: hypothetical protein VF787_02480 [Thermoanaerobaculia bacterium]
MSDWQRSKRTAMILGILGILTEAITLYLLASKQIAESVATPILVGGMLLAFIPLFVVARHSKRPR